MRPSQRSFLGWMPTETRGTLSTQSVGRAQGFIIPCCFPCRASCSTLGEDSTCLRGSCLTPEALLIADMRTCPRPPGSGVGTPACPTCKVFREILWSPTLPSQLGRGTEHACYPPSAGPGTALMSIRLLYERDAVFEGLI